MEQNCLNKKINDSLLKAFVSDITLQDTDAIVNAANKQLSPGGGVSGAIHKAAGPLLWEECKKIGHCPTGHAVITKGYALKAKYVIHTVGPIYTASSQDPLDLENCYCKCLALASKNNIRSIAFPSISTGIFGYPIEEASLVAIRSIIKYLNKYTNIKYVNIVLFTECDFRTYEKNWPLSL